MRIGIVCYPTYGGSGVIATELGKALASNGHEVHFIAYRQPARLMNTYSANLYYHEVSYNDYPLFEHSPYETALASRLVDVAKNEKLDLLHVHYAIPHASVAYLAKKILEDQGIHLPVITTLHGTDITLVGLDSSYDPVVTFSINHSDGVTAVSEYLKQATYENFKIDKEIKVIPNFIDFSRFSKIDKEHFKKAIAPDGEKVMIHTSNFRKVKRVDDVVRIFSTIREKIPAKLLLVGDGPDRHHVEETCRQLGACDDIRFLGKQEAVEELLAVSDLFIMPSGSESFGLAALEAMACEVPVISSNIGGIPEININGQTGYLADVGDIETMAERSLDLLTNDVKLDEFKANAFEWAKKFRIENILPLYEEYYEEILDGEKVV